MSITNDFKDTLASWASGVSVVTAQQDGLVYGLTVSSFSSLSLDPPLILVCLNNSNRLPAMIEESGGFAVSILSRDQEEASNYFARAGREPTSEFTEIEGQWLHAGVPVVRNALAHLVCRHQETIPQGDHAILIGEVVHASSQQDGEPLLYFRRGYRSVSAY